MAVVTVAALLSLAAHNLASPEQAFSFGGSPHERLATATDPAGRITLMTKVNGRGPFPFTIDTGANRSVISDRLAAQLGLKSNGTVVIEGLVGPDEVSSVRLDRIKAGSVEQAEIDTAVLPAASLGSTGFLGTDMLQGRNVVLDFRQHNITLTRGRGSDSDGETITVYARRRLGQLVMTDAAVGKVKVVAIIDTGAENTIGNPALRKMLMGTKPQGAMGELIGVTGKTIPGEAGTLPATARTYARWLPHAERGRAFGLAIMTGAFAGAHHGAEAWPGDWADRIEYQSDLMSLGALWDA